jgi:hypothetical protein
MSEVIPFVAQGGFYDPHMQEPRLIANSIEQNNRIAEFQKTVVL